MEYFLNRNKFYKVEETILNNGKTIYVVYGCQSLIQKVFGIWSEYKKKHSHPFKAKEHIDYLKRCEVVYSKQIKYSRLLNI